jgi:polyphosphate kinase
VPRLEERFDPKIRERLFHTTLKPQWPSLLTHGNISRQIDKGDVLLSYPYDSMRPLNELVREASEDNRVLSIKMTLYRIGNQSQIVQNLCAAAESGKDVTVIIELRARFDEQNNINWASVMEESGCKVIYGIDDYKVHSKIILITRRAAHGLEYIVNIATGNYNESTTRLYADLSLCMTDPVICDDAVRFFHNIEIGNIFGSYRRLLVSPSTLKQGIINMITEEIVKASDGKPARIVFKMNSLTDKEIIEKLIEASQAGVKISLIIRGICCLRPNVPDYTDNIEIISIVGRFLEHARVYCFGEGVGAKLYIGSADMMTRNTEHRIEILAPVDDLKLKARIMDMLETQLKDNVKSRILNANGNYTPVQTDGEQIDSQMLFYEQAYRLAEMATLQQKVIKPSRAPVKQLRGLRNRLVNIRKSRIPKV